MEEEEGRWSSREIKLYVGGWGVHGGERIDGGIYCGRRERDVEDEERETEDRIREMGSEQHEVDRGGALEDRRRYGWGGSEE